MRACRIHAPADPAGAINVLRLGGKLAAPGVMVFDVLKGVIPVWIGYSFGLPLLWLGLVAIAACLGHIYSVFFNFYSDKRVTTVLEGHCAHRI